MFLGKVCKVLSYFFISAIPTVTVKQSLYSVDIAQPITLECTVVASPIHTSVYWQKVVNGIATTITANQNKYSGSSVGTPSLTIGNVDFNDEAYYICFATNEVGTGQSAQTYLDVIGSKLLSISPFKFYPFFTYVHLSFGFYKFPLCKSIVIYVRC